LETELIRGDFKNYQVNKSLSVMFTIIKFSLLWWLIANFFCFQETLVHRSLPLEQPGFCRGFRKSLQGRWKRLVKKKPINETYAIPPELRDQLKNIYVYW